MALKSLFFYGTLRHVALLETVLDRSRSGLDLVEAVLPDHACYWVKDQVFPLIAQEPGAQAQGLILRNVTDEDTARLDYYEGGFAYDVQQRTAHTSEGEEPVSVYVPQAGRWAKGRPFSLQDWEKDWAALSCLSAREAMDAFGIWSAEDLAGRLPMIRRRNNARKMAGARGPSPDHRAGADRIAVLSRTRVHSHFFALDHLHLTHPRFDGATSEVLEREVFFVGDAVTVLPYDPVRDTVLLTEQFRPNVFANGDPSPWVIEPVSGFVDPGESAEQAAFRESQEEAGVTPDRLELVSASYSSTGSSTEFVSIYIGLADFGTRSGGGGLTGEGEDILIHEMPFAELEEGLRTHRFRDTPLITAALWLMLHRNRLRGTA